MTQLKGYSDGLYKKELEKKGGARILAKEKDYFRDSILGVGWEERNGGGFIR